MINYPIKTKLTKRQQKFILVNILLEFAKTLLISEIISHDVNITNNGTIKGYPFPGFTYNGTKHVNISFEYMPEKYYKIKVE
jgi:hypothetical protein